MIWRRPNRLRPWAVGAVAAALTVAGGFLVAEAPKEWESGAALLGFLAMSGAFVLVFGESVPSGPGWLVGGGRLESVEVRAWSGQVVGTPRPVKALDPRPRRWGGRTRLDAVLDDGRSITIITGRPDRVAAFAGWLSDRADLPLAPAGGGVIGMTVASRQVNR